MSQATQPILEAGGGTPPATPPATPPSAGTPPATPPAGAPPPKAFFDGLIDGTGKINKANWDSLPDSLKQHKDVFGKYDSFEALLNGFGNAHNMGVKKALLPLDSNATPEMQKERKEFLDQMVGVPKDPKGYGIEKPKDIPTEHWDQALADEAVQVSQQLSIPPKALQALMSIQTKSVQKMIAEGQKNVASFFADQDKTFEDAVQQQGKTTDEAMALLNKAVSTFGGIKPDSPRLKMADVRLALIHAASMIGESQLKSGDGTGGQAMDEMAIARDIMTNPKNPEYEAWQPGSGHPRAQEIRDKVTALYRAAGEKAIKRGLAAP